LQCLRGVKDVPGAQFSAQKPFDVRKALLITTYVSKISSDKPAQDKMKASNGQEAVARAFG